MNSIDLTLVHDLPLTCFNIDIINQELRIEASDYTISDDLFGNLKIIFKGIHVITGFYDEFHLGIETEINSIELKQEGNNTKVDLVILFGFSKPAIKLEFTASDISVYLEPISC